MTPKPLRKLRVLVTCGPTREPLDPVRFLSNRSTGTLGIALARTFARRGHSVTLAAGPIALPLHIGKEIRVIRFETARDLHRLALKESRKADAVCMTAAVADFRPAVAASGKMKRGTSALTVKLVPNPDILADLGRRKPKGQILVGFSVESSRLGEEGEKKLFRKNLDLLAAQTVGGAKTPFGDVRLDVLLLGRGGSREELRNVSKAAYAARIVRRIEGIKRNVIHSKP